MEENETENWRIIHAQLGGAFWGTTLFENACSITTVAVLDLDTKTTCLW